MSLSLRAVEIYQPYGNETPEDLLWAEGASEEFVEYWLDAKLVRIAKLGEEILGMYSMALGDRTTYELRGVVVAPARRKQGLGRWLVGHAIGVAESKGGRHVLFPETNAKRFFGHIGFVDDPRGQRFDLIPE